MESPSLRAWATVGFLAVVACLNYLDRVMLATMHQSILSAIPMTEAQFGLLTSVFLWVYAFLSPFAGFVGDRLSRSVVIVGSLLVWSLVTWATAHATNFPELLAARALMGVSEACYIPAALALITDFHRGPTRSLATGIHMVGISVGSGLGGLGGVLAERHTWNYAFNLFGAIGVAYAILLLFALRDAPDRTASRRAKDPQTNVHFAEAMVSLFSDRNFILAIAFWGLLGLAGWAFIGWLPTYLLEEFHVSQGSAGMSATGLLQPAAWVGLVVGGAWADRWSRRNPRGRILVAVIGLAIAGPAVLAGTLSGVFTLTIAGFMVYSCGSGFSNANMMPILCMVTDPRYRATGYGVLNFCACSVGGLTIYFGGALRDAHIPVSVIFEAAAASTVLCAGLLLLLVPRRGGNAAPTAPDEALPGPVADLGEPTTPRP